MDIHTDGDCNRVCVVDSEIIAILSVYSSKNRELQHIVRISQTYNIWGSIETYISRSAALYYDLKCHGQSVKHEYMRIHSSWTRSVSSFDSSDRYAGFPTVSVSESTGYSKKTRT